MSWLAEELTTLALCWRIERRDGVTIGLTDHDRDLVVDGLTHRAAPGMVPSAIVRSSGIRPPRRRRCSIWPGRSRSSWSAPT